MWKALAWRRNWARQLHVIHVAKVGDNLLGNPSESEALEYLYQISKDHGADMTMIRSNEVAATISAHARKVSAVAVVMGRLAPQPPHGVRRGGRCERAPERCGDKNGIRRGEMMEPTRGIARLRCDTIRDSSG